MTTQPGENLLHYRLIDKIGEGGMGAVWAAEDTRLGRKVAVKILPPETAKDPERLARFEREARAVAALNHPNIITLHSVEHTEDKHFLTMELIEGRSLTSAIPEMNSSLARFLDVALPLVEALAAAHQQGITHRDLKPDNVMITDEGRIKVLDFGLA
jgi:serine/threonine protein kinase